MKKVIYEIPYTYVVGQSKKEFEFQPLIGRQHYITSLAIANNALAISDNQGYISIANIDKIRQCINTEVNSENIFRKDKKRFDKYPEETIIKKSAANPIKSIKCDDYIIAQSRDGHANQPVRSVALTQNGCYLASAGDDGKVIIWRLASNKTADKLFRPEKFVVQQAAGTKFNSVDIKALKDENENYVIVASGDDNYNVKLYRINGIKDDASCK